MPLFILFALPFSSLCSAEDTVASPGSPSVDHMVKRINERYDDFFRYHRELDERWEKRRATVGERKKLEQAHLEKVEQARLDYVKTRKARASDEPLRIRHEAAEKERAANNEMLRRRYVQQRDTVEQYLKKGRSIPELKEFDLEGY